MYEVTLKDIAQRAGCSVNTVSLALKNSDRISAKTRARIQKVAQELNYIPNNMARTLVLKKSGTIGLVLRNISSHVLAAEARLIEQYLEQKGYTMYITTSRDHLRLETQAINLMLSNKADGLILNTKFVDNIPRMEQLHRSGFPVVLISGFVHDSPTLDAVYPDLVKGAYIATRHLLEIGHSRVAFVLDSKDDERKTNPKFAGYRQALAERGIPFEENMVFSLRLDSLNAGDDDTLDRLLRRARAETAFFISEDEIALPVLKFLSRAGVRIPEELAIASMDNISFAENAVVSLTSVGYDLRRLSYQAVDLLTDAIAGKRSTELYEMFPVAPELHVRDSCGYRTFRPRRRAEPAK